MSNAIQNCPRCDSFILSDTYECPECGHVFDDSKAAAARAAKEAREAEQRKLRDLHDPCPNCGEMVRSGLVRCWKCNSFMREDVAERYKNLTSNPQPIIFSDIPAEQRTEFIPAREGQYGQGYGRDVFDAEEDEDDFTLEDDGPVGTDQDRFDQIETGHAVRAETDAGGDFELDADLSQPESGTPASATEAPSAEAQQPAGDDAAESSSAAASGDTQGPAHVDADDLLNIAMKEQKETHQRRRARLQQAKQKRILIPCRCGAWVRVTEEQSGRTVRCRQCKQPLVVPEIRKKEKPAAGKKKETVPQIHVDWVNDVRLHVLNPTDLVLKPGSLEKEFEPVDVGFHESGLRLIKFGGGGKKKGLFGRGSSDGDTTEQRAKVREHITSTGGFTGLPHGELISIDADKVSQVRLVQPVAQAHESMFAGVPVFGEGRIAVYLPLQPGDNQQAFLSFPLSTFRQFAHDLEETHAVQLPAAENGVPAKEDTETLSCFISQNRIESLRNLVFYQHDDAFEVELTGYKCTACGTAVSEESRAKKKLGGAAGKSIAKAKCPKCSGKMGTAPLYRISRAPEKPGDDGSAAESTAPTAAATAANVPESDDAAPAGDAAEST